MEIEKIKQIIESIMFAVGRDISVNELASVLELAPENIEEIIESMRIEFDEAGRGIQIIKVNNGYQLCSRKENYEYIYQIIDKRNKPNLSQAALETLAIIAYNPKITRAEIESIRGVNSDGTIYKLLEHNLIEDVGRLDAPGRPTTYATTKEFLRMFGYSSLEELPELPRYKLDENQQIVIDDLVTNEEPKEEINNEVPMPERDEDNNNE
jgi:segregation and condensation protein B